MPDDTPRFERHMKRKSAYIMKLEARVLERRQEVDRAARRQLQDKQTFLSGNFLGRCRTVFNSVKNADQRNRPSDQQFPVRSYSRVDGEVWQRPEIRRWFDAFSTPMATEAFDPLVSGYTVTADFKSNAVPPPMMRTAQVMPTPSSAEEQARLQKASKL
ncbi:unnamed protein product [Ascophyllum nodosum]